MVSLWAQVGRPSRVLGLTHSHHLRHRKTRDPKLEAPHHQRQFEAGIEQICLVVCNLRGVSEKSGAQFTHPSAHLHRPPLLATPVVLPTDGAYAVRVTHVHRYVSASHPCRGVSLVRPTRPTPPKGYARGLSVRCTTATTGLCYVLLRRPAAA